MFSMGDPLYNLTSQLYSGNWYSGLYGLGNRASGHCHTFNPENVSVAGHQGQLYAYLGNTHHSPRHQSDHLTDLCLQDCPPAVF